MKNRECAAAACERHRDESQGILYISAGLPGAGKSTFLKTHKANNEVIVSRDEIRFSLLKEGEEYFKHEEKVFKIFIHQICENILAGKNVYADATHLTPMSQIKVLAPILLETAPPQINYIYFDVPLDICLERNELRKGTKSFCPRGIIRRMKETADFQPCSFIDNAWTVDKDGKVSKMR